MENILTFSVFVSITFSITLREKQMSKEIDKTISTKTLFSWISLLFLSTLQTKLKSCHSAQRQKGNELLADHYASLFFFSFFVATLPFISYRYFFANNQLPPIINNVGRNYRMHFIFCQPLQNVLWKNYNTIKGCIRIRTI